MNLILKKIQLKQKYPLQEVLLNIKIRVQVVVLMIINKVYKVSLVANHLLRRINYRKISRLNLMNTIIYWIKFIIKFEKNNYIIKEYGIEYKKIKYFN